MTEKGDGGCGVAMRTAVLVWRSMQHCGRVRADSYLTSSLTRQVWWYEALIPKWERVTSDGSLGHMRSDF